jgi:X-Pro dipeptidyl-peptidase C-terminal non-catalytic domain
MARPDVPLRRRMVLAAAITAVLAAVLGTAGRAAAAGPRPGCPLGLAGTAHTAPAGGVAYTVCTGRVASFDGTPLDLDLTLPANAHGALPLMVMLHGWGNSKTDVVSTPSPGPGPEAVETDPIANGGLPGTTSGCRIMSITTDPGVAAWTWSPSTPVTLAGAPVVGVTVALNGTDAELAARLWDVDPATGKQALITRAVYRLTAPAPGQVQNLAFELWPTAWELGAGHQLKLELTPDDSPTWRPDNLPATMTLTKVTLTIPVRGG